MFAAQEMPHSCGPAPDGSHTGVCCIIVKLREMEGQGVDPGRSLKGHLWMVDGGWWISFP